MFLPRAGGVPAGEAAVARLSCGACRTRPSPRTTCHSTEFGPVAAELGKVTNALCGGKQPSQGPMGAVTCLWQIDSLAEVGWCLCKTKGEVMVEGSPRDSSAEETNPAGQEGLGSRMLSPNGALALDGCALSCTLGHVVSLLPRQREAQIWTCWAQTDTQHAQGLGALPSSILPGPADGAVGCQSKGRAQNQGQLPWEQLGDSCGRPVASLGEAGWEDEVEVWRPKCTPSFESCRTIHSFLCSLIHSFSYCACWACAVLASMGLGGRLGGGQTLGQADGFGP